MSTNTLESVAMEMFEDEYDREARSTPRHRMRKTAHGHVEVCPVAWVMPELLNLIAERHGEPVEHLRPCIRKLIAEKAFAFGPGMGSTNEFHDPQEAVDHEVDLIVRALERVRTHALECGKWSSLECSGEMYVG